MSIEKLVSPLVESQFPSFYRDEGENFIAFTKAYYQWLEQSNNVIGYSRNLLDLRDIDTTIDDFILYFKEKYLKNIEFNSATNKRLLLKNSLDIYRSKGTDRSVDLLFKLIYGSGAQIYRPGDDLFKLSDGEWTRPKYIEISSSRRTVDLVGKQITGVTSGATAFIEKYIKRRVKDSYVNILSVSNLSGTFRKNELLKANTVYSDLPKIVGSMTHLTVTDGGDEFNIGDIVTVYSSSGDYGQARVSNTTNRTGLVDFLFEDGGFGYTAAPTILISNTTLRLANVTQTDTQIWSQFETITQPLSNVEYTADAGAFTEGERVFTVTGTGVGRVLSMNLLSTPKWLKISRESGTFLSTDIIYNTGNTANGTISSHTNVDISGKLVATPTELTLIVQSSEGLTPQIAVYQSNSTAEVANAIIKSVSNTLVELSNVVGTFVTSANLNVRSAATNTAVQSIQTNIALSNTTGTFLTTYSPLVRGADSGPEGYVSSIASGTDANFDIASITNTEIIYLNTDIIDDYLSVTLNAVNYGLPANTSANLSSYLFSSWEFDPYTVGEITGITNINPGEGYSTNPEVVIHEPLVAALEEHDYWMVIANTTASFSIGEEVTQNNTYDFYDLLVASNTGWLIGEYVYVGVDFASRTGGGNILTITDNTLRIRNITGAFTDGQTLKSLVYPATTTTITTATSDPAAVVQTSGEVLFANATHLHVARMQLDYDFIVNGGSIVGTDTGASATISHLSGYANTPVVGLNAIIETDVVTANGTATELSITDSGYGYANAQVVTFVADDDSTGTAVVTTSALGTGRGYFKSSKGFLSDDKFLHDGDYYQEYSYEVLSRLPFDRYSDMLKRVLHVAGSKAFGSLLLESAATVATTTGQLSSSSSNSYLTLDFADQNYVVNDDWYEPLDIFPGYTFTRSGEQGAFDASGAVQWFAANVPAINSSGYHAYGALTNLLVRSQEFDNASWVKNNVTVTANQGVAPDGTTTMDRVVPTTGLDNIVIKSLAQTTSGWTGYRSLSVIAKADGLRYFSMGWHNGGGYTASGLFDLQNGVVVSTGAHPDVATEMSATIRDLGGGSYFCVFVINALGVLVSTPYFCGSSSSVGGLYNRDITGDGVGGTLIWQAGEFSGNFTGTMPLIRTTGASLAIGASDLKISDAPPSIDQLIWATANIPRINTGESQRLAYFNDGTDNNIINMSIDGAGAIRVSAVVDAVDQYSQVVANTDAALTIVLRRLGGNWRGGKIVDGVLTWFSADTAGSFPTMTQVHLGEYRSGIQQTQGELVGVFRKTGSFSTDAAVLAAVAGAD